MSDERPTVNLCSDCKHRHASDLPTPQNRYPRLMPCGKHPEAFLQEARRWCEGSQWEAR